MSLPKEHATLTSELRTSSGTFLSMSQRARVAEWEKMTGARVTASTSLAVRAEAWERSTISPTRFISRTNSCGKTRRHKEKVRDKKKRKKDIASGQNWEQK